MENIKAKVTQDIVDSIIDDVKRETVEINTRFNERLQDELDHYRKKKEAVVDAKLQTLDDQVEKKAFKIESELRFDNAKRLREKRNALLSDLHQRMEADILDFVKHSDYGDFMNSIIESLQSQFDLKDAVIKIRKEDRVLLEENLNYEYSDLKYGGLICEIGHHIYDYSLETRFKDAMQRFINESNVTI